MHGTPLLLFAPLKGRGDLLLDVKKVGRKGRSSVSSFRKERERGKREKPRVGFLGEKLDDAMRNVSSAGGREQQHRPDAAGAAETFTPLSSSPSLFPSNSDDDKERATTSSVIL